MSTISVRPLPDRDYHQLLIDEGRPFHRGLNKLNKDCFNQFVKDNFKFFGQFDSFEEIVPSALEYEKIRQGDAKIMPGQCHYNAKSVSLRDCKYEYVTGFVFRNDPFEEQLVPHSFNVIDGKTVDFSRRESNGSLLQSLGYFPQTYFGVVIPVDFLRSFEENPTMNPGLYEWMEQNKMCQKDSE